MIIYQWDDEKNAILKKNRGVSFEQVVMHIENGDVLDVMAHPNKTPRVYAAETLIMNTMAVR